MDIRLLKTFLLVANLLNITKAAEQLRFSQPAITAQICSLEDMLSVQLFKRSGKRLELTLAGEKMIHYAERFVGLYEETTNALAAFGRAEDVIRLAVSTHMISYYLPALLRELQAQMPHTHVSVDVCMYTPEVLKGIAEDRYDLGFVHGKNTVQQIRQHGVWTEEILWVASADFVENHPPVSNIEQYPIINYTKGSVFRNKLEQSMEGTGFNSPIEYSDSEAIKRAVLSGLGISYLPKTLVEDEIAKGKLCVLKQGPCLELNISLVHRVDKTFSLPMYALLLAIANQPGADSSIKILL